MLLQKGDIREISNNEYFRKYKCQLNEMVFISAS